MGSNLADIVLNQLIGVVVGAAVSFIMSWYFYKKADFPAKVAGEMIEDVFAMIIQSRLEADLSFEEVPSKDQLPKKRDIPHIKRFLCSAKTLKPGESVLLLFRVEDTGFNFPGSENVTVTETASRIGFPVSRQGHGYYSCQVDFPHNAMPGYHTVEFRLIDSEGNSHTQSIKLSVKGLSPQSAAGSQHQSAA